MLMLYSQNIVIYQGSIYHFFKNKISSKDSTQPIAYNVHKPLTQERTKNKHTN